MYADEADQDGSKEFLVYAAVFFPAQNIGKIHNRVSELRAEYGFAPEHPLKFSPGSIPQSISRDQHAELKSKVLQAAGELNCKTCCNIVPSSIARKRDLETKLKWGVNTLCQKFDEFLIEKDIDAGLIKLDRTTDYRQEAYIKDVFQNGLEFNGTRRKLSRIAAIDTTQDGLSHMSSITDIVVGSYRFAVNEPEKDQVGAKLTKALAKLMWAKKLPDGKLSFGNRGLVIRPQNIQLSDYRADVEAFVTRMNGYLNS